jgi:CspA family cold shock protein
MGRGNEHRDRRRQSGDQPADPRGDYPPSPTYERSSRQLGGHASSGRDAEARVKWFNPDKGFGFVELTDGSGEPFLHVRQVEAAGHTSLEAGTTIIVKVGAGQKGQQVNEILSVDTSTADPELFSAEGRAAGERVCDNYRHRKVV